MGKHKLKILFQLFTWVKKIIREKALTKSGRFTSFSREYLAANFFIDLIWLGSNLYSAANSSNIIFSLEDLK